MDSTKNKGESPAKAWEPGAVLYDLLEPLGMNAKIGTTPEIAMRHLYVQIN